MFPITWRSANVALCRASLRTSTLRQPYSVDAHSAHTQRSQAYAPYELLSHALKGSSDLFGKTLPQDASRLLRQVILEPSEREKLRPQDVERVVQLLSRRGLRSMPTPWLVQDDLSVVRQMLKRCRDREEVRQYDKIRRQSDLLRLTLTHDEILEKAQSHALVDKWREVHEMLVSFETSNAMQEQMRRRQASLDALRHALDVTFTSSQRNEDAQAFESILQLIVRLLPPCYKDTRRLKRLQRLDLNGVVFRRDRNVGLPSSATDETQDIRLYISSSFHANQPTTSVGLFNEVWQAMMRKQEPSSRAYVSAVALETKMASWRLAVLQRNEQDAGQVALRQHDTRDSEERIEDTALDHHKEHTTIIQPWRGVTDLLTYIHRERNRLTVEHISTCMWGAMRYHVSLYEHSTHESQQDWPPLESVFATYDLLRNNVMETSQADERTQKAIEPLLGVDLAQSLPRFVPNQEMYESMMVGLAGKGYLKEALHVFCDMTGIAVNSIDRESQKCEFAPSTTTFDALFHGFAKYGVPSKLVELDVAEPSSSEWEHDEKVRADMAHSPWNIETLCEILEIYLKMKPGPASSRGVSHGTESSLYEAKEGDYDPQQRDPNDVEHSSARLSYWPLQDEYAPIDLFANRAERNADAGIVRARNRYAPTPHHLFNILTALRRASGDHPTWVLLQFTRVKRHFGPPGDELEEPTTSDEAKGANENGWTGWRLGNRVPRVLDMLLDRHNA